MLIIQSDGHVEYAWRDALAACAALRRIRDEGVRGFNGFGDFLADVFHLLCDPAPYWNVLPWPTFHECVLRDMADLPEFRKLRILASEDRGAAIPPTCAVGWQLSQPGATDLLRALQAEALGQAYAEMATQGQKAAEQLALRLGEQHPVVAEAEEIVQKAFDAARNAFQTMERPGADDARLSQFRRALRSNLRAHGPRTSGC
jgi:hypothetical protein